MTGPIDAADEAFHLVGEDPYWMESAWFGFAIPEQDMIGFVYFFHDVRTGVSGGGPALWDPSGEETYDCLFYDWRWNQPVTGHLDFRDLRLPNSLRQQVLEPLQRYRLSYSELGLHLDLEWTALMPPHEMRYGDLETMTGTRHFDQPGRGHWHGGPRRPTARCGLLRAATDRPGVAVAGPADDAPARKPSMAASS
jgi:hypothetical protein